MPAGVGEAAAYGSARSSHGAAHMGLFSSTLRDGPRDASGAPRADRLVRAAALVTVLVLAPAALKLARPVLVPLVGGVFLAVVARPIQRGVAARLPRRLRWLGLLAAMLLVFVGLGAFAAGLGASGRAVAEALRERRPQLEASLQRTRERLVRAGLPASALPGLPGGTFAPAPPPGGPAADAAGAPPPGTSGDAAARAPAAGAGAGGGGLSDAAPRLAAGTVEALGNLLLALAFCALGLAEGEAARARFARAAPGPGGAAALDSWDQATRNFRRYAWVKTITSTITGVATWLAALALGLPLAWVWGFLTFLLEYIPSVGSVLAVVPPTLMGLAEGGAGRGLAVFLTVGTLQVVLGNVVDPKIEGRLMQLSPFAVLLAILVWGWLWGAVGALLAVPLTVALVVVCRHVAGLGGVATVLAGEDASDDGGGQAGGGGR